VTRVGKTERSGAPMKKTIDECIDDFSDAVVSVAKSRSSQQRRLRQRHVYTAYVALGERVEDAESWLVQFWDDNPDDTVIGVLHKYELGYSALSRAVSDLDS
jgi:hypothetical protein